LIGLSSRKKLAIDRSQGIVSRSSDQKFCYLGRSLICKSVGKSGACSLG